MPWKTIYRNWRLEWTLRQLRRQFPSTKIYPCGSFYVCNPPVLNTDIDFLVYCPPGIRPIISRAGYKESANYHYRHGASYRKGKINLIVTKDAKWADDWILA